MKLNNWFWNFGVCINSHLDIWSSLISPTWPALLSPIYSFANLRAQPYNTFPDVRTSNFWKVCFFLTCNMLGAFIWLKGNLYSNFTKLRYVYLDYSGCCFRSCRYNLSSYGVSASKGHTPCSNFCDLSVPQPNIHWIHGVYAYICIPKLPKFREIRFVFVDSLHQYCRRFLSLKLV